jgi:hypothetical protein
LFAVFDLNLHSGTLATAGIANDVPLLARVSGLNR